MNRVRPVDRAMQKRVNMYHLAGIGHKLQKIANEKGEVVLRCTQVVEHPQVTLCGKKIVESTRVIVPWDNPKTCKKCLRKVSSVDTDRLQGVMF